MNFIVLVVVAVGCCTSISSEANLPNDHRDVGTRLMQLEEDFDGRITKLEELMTQTRNFVADLVTRLAKSENNEQLHTITKRQADDEPIMLEALDDKLQSVIDLHGETGAPGAPGPSGEAGVPGLNGPPGPPGPMGFPGPAGEDGRNGTDGFDGSQGPVGPQGKVGPIGPAGGDGSNGTDGSAGQPGNPGSIGPIGQRGADGRDGVPGSDGRDGLPGAVGTAGTPGAVGAAGSPGSCSTQGNCPSPYRIVEGKCIHIPSGTLSWASAKQYCENQGAYLLTFSSKSSSEKFGEFLYIQVSASRDWWIGAKKVSGDYYWMGITTGRVPENGSSGSQWTDFHDGCDCLEYLTHSNNGKGWHATSGHTCDTIKHFICEKLI